MSKAPIRVLLADDHRVLRDGLHVLLESEEDMHVVAEASNGKDAIRLANKFQPDVIVMDLGMPGTISGMEAIPKIKQDMPHIRIVVLSMHSGREVVMQALEAGSDGYVPKSAAHMSLLQAIRAVHEGQRFLDPSAATVVLDKLMEKREERKLLTVLSDRELEVLRLTAMGYTSRESGQQLGLSPKTVDTYRYRVMEKLDFQHRSELIQFALRAGLLEDD